MVRVEQHNRLATATVSYSSTTSRRRCSRSSKGYRPPLSRLQWNLDRFPGELATHRRQRGFCCSKEQNVSVQTGVGQQRYRRLHANLRPLCAAYSRWSSTVPAKPLCLVAVVGQMYPGTPTPAFRQRLCRVDRHHTEHPQEEELAVRRP